MIYLFAAACSKKGTPADNNQVVFDYRQEMRTFIRDISARARQQQPHFHFVPQDGLSFLTNDGDSSGTPVTAYLNAINGVAQEEAYYGYDNDDDAAARNAYPSRCRVAKANGKRVLVTDHYCFTVSTVNTSYGSNAANGFISYASHRELGKCTESNQFRCIDIGCLL